MKAMKDLTSEYLLNAVREGDPEAFNEVYYRYERKVYSYAYRFTRSAEEAEELTQDLFVRLWESRLAIDPERNFEGYLYILIRNSFLKTIRKNAKSVIVRFEFTGEEISYSPTDDYINFKDCQQITDRAVGSLSPQVKTAYLLSRHEGRSHEDISRSMDLSKNTVNNHIKKSLSVLRKYFKAYSPDTILLLLLFIFF